MGVTKPEQPQTLEEVIWMGVTKPEQPQTLEEVIAHYKGDSRVVDANHDVFDYVMLRKEFTEDNQGNPTPEGQG